jgi:predicted CoA-binding protein
MRVLIIGASSKPDRYAYKATERLIDAEIEVYLLGNREGVVLNQKIETKMPENDSIDTVTMYVGPKHQEQYFTKLVDLSPRRVIFNPGTENILLQELLESKGIEVVVNCTLVMLSFKNF